MSCGFADAIAAASGQVVLAGATLGGYAYDDLERRNGVFSAAVIDGLRGQADVDERGFITVRTLADYLNRRVAAWVRDHRPEHEAVSRGIAQRLEGDAARLPLAVDPARREAEAAYRRQRDAALARLRENIGETITGTLYDEMAAVLAGVRLRPEAEPLLLEIEALHGDARSQRSLAYYFDRNRAVLLGGKRPPPAVITVPQIEPERSTAGGNAKRRWLYRVAAVVGLIVVSWIALTIWSERERESPEGRFVPPFEALAYANQLSGKAGL